MPLAGLARMRKHQFGRQASFGTAIAATRVYPFKGVPSVNLNWTDPDVDTGSLDPVWQPYRTTNDITSSLTAPSVAYNDLPLMLSGFFGNAVTPTGAGDSKTWAYTPASTTVDDVDVFTEEFGDDVTDDWYQLRDGILQSLEIAGPEGLGAMSATMSWRYAAFGSSGSTDSAASPAVPTALDPETNCIWVYLKDAQIAIASDPADFGTSQVMDALHSFTLRLSGDLDQKRYVNGTQTFDVQAYGRATRSIELELVFAKTSDTVGTGSESDAWMSDAAVDRFVEIKFTSTAIAETPSTFYSWVFSMPLRYYTRTETEAGGNTTVTLTGHAFFDPSTSDTGFDGAFKTTVVNTLATL